jgi:hypothetical protein
VSEQKVCPVCSTEYPLSERFCPRDGSALRSTSTTGDLIGQVIADRYHVIKKLGEGGMGAVYLAEHVKMGRKSAIKVMNPGMNTDPDAIARFNREASNASRLSHINICGIYDFGETPDGLIYLAMEFIEGVSLTALIEQHVSLPPARAASIIHQAADALQVAHDAGIVHRDLKPDNIMIAKGRDGTDLVKVVDFGIAKASSSEAQNVTRAGLVVGTPEYMSPEQLAADKLDGRSDQYSLALVAFNCLTGKLPFPADSAQEAMIARLTEQPRTLAEMRPDIEWPEALQAVLDKAIARDAAERYAGAAIFGREFASAIADMPATQAAEGATQVIGAAGLAAAADAKTKAIPATRVASKSGGRGAPAPAAAAPVETKKSPVPMIAGGGGVLAVAAVVYFMFLKGPAPVPPVDPGQVGANNPAVTTPASTTPPAPDSTPATKAPAVQPLSNPLPPANNPVTPPVNAPTVASLASRLDGWLKETQVLNAPPAVGRRVLGELEGVKAGLAGRQLGEWHYVELHALLLMEDAEETCRSARDVKRLLTDRSRLLVADATIAELACP